MILLYECLSQPSRMIVVIASTNIRISSSPQPAEINKMSGQNQGHVDQLSFDFEQAVVDANLGRVEVLLNQSSRMTVGSKSGAFIP